MIITKAETQNIYMIDAEFIDTPEHSELLSFAIVSETDSRYFEFDYEERWLTPWLRENVIPHLDGSNMVTVQDAAAEISLFVPNVPEVEIWGFYGAYDFYWLCRLFGGNIDLPPAWPRTFRDLAHYTDTVPDLDGRPVHHAENDAVSQLARLFELIDDSKAPG
jgi:hypothetical protein